MWCVMRCSLLVFLTLAVVHRPGRNPVPGAQQEQGPCSLGRCGPLVCVWDWLSLSSSPSSPHFYPPPFPLFTSLLPSPFSQGPRAQIDRDVFRQRMQEAVRGVSGLAIQEDSVEDLVLAQSQQDGGGRFKVDGVCLGMMSCRLTRPLQSSMG